MLGRLKTILGHDSRGPLPDLDALRDRVVRLCLGYIISFSAPVLILGIVLSMGESWNWYATTQLVAYSCCLIGYFAFPRNKSKCLSYYVVAIVILLGCSGIAAWGPSPSRFIVLSFGCLFAALFSGARFAFAAIVSSTGLVCFAAWANQFIAIDGGGDSVSHHSVRQWIVTILSFAFYSACGCLMVAWVARSLQNSIKVLFKREGELRETNALLRKQAVELEVQALELEKQAEVLTEQRDLADQASKAKDRFLSVISHELRTPMNPILGFLDLLESEGRLGGESQERLTLMRQSGEHLLYMIDKLVDFSEMDSGKLQLNPSSVSWLELKTKARARLKPFANQGRVELSIQCSESDEDRVSLDRKRTLQVVQELGMNALKFTSVGQVLIDFSLARKADSADWICIRVVDTGMGMDEAMQKSLFASFSQVDDSRTREFGGLGLGLSICESLVRSMEGTIAVESSLGHGSMFTIRFPVKVMPRQDSAPRAVEKLKVFSKPISVLVAEDDMLNQRVVTALLKRIGANATCVEDGKQAIEALRTSQYDVVLMDLSMPVLDGLSAAREIRRIESIKDTPIIALTAHSYSKCEESCAEAGMNGFLTKPARADKLFEAIARSMGAKQASRN
ncbi:response regulator [Pelagicoccus albus]|uniref:histidine kinase n=1 Tax=Pelagicoccus albus TaxID=415222 RepID=A0A7X1B5Y6_9BACT|nr:response regulator [Pelagicoccus albus]MBC2606256.1 response regulator [Pelagicoccus albus]